MRVRQLDTTVDALGNPAYDMQFGKGQANYYQDQPEAVGQLVLTRLNLYSGEWFLDTTDGTAWRTDALGKNTAALRDPMIRRRVLATPGVTAIRSYASQTNRQARGFSAQTTINTAYSANAVSVSTANGVNLDVRQGR